MMIFYVEQAKAYFTLAEDGAILLIDRAKGRIDPRAHRAHALSIGADGRRGLHGDLLYIDGWGLTDLVAWIWREHQGVSMAAFGRHFWRCFYGDTHVTATAKAVIRLINGIPAYGEDSYFVAQQWRQHPDEFAELRDAVIASKPSMSASVVSSPVSGSGE